MFLDYVNELNQASNILDLLMFADDKKLSYSHHQVKIPFETVNCELKNISQWFRANKLSLNTKKAKYTFFHKYSIRNKIALKSPTLEIGSKVMEKTKFLGVILNENVS